MSAEPIQIETEPDTNSVEVGTTPQSYRRKDWTFLNHASRVTIGNETDLENLVSLLEQTVLQTLARYHFLKTFKIKKKCIYFQL